MEAYPSFEELNEMARQLATEEEKLKTVQDQLDQL